MFVGTKDLFFPLLADVMKNTALGWHLSSMNPLFPAALPPGVTAISAWLRVLLSFSCASQLLRWGRFATLKGLPPQTPTSAQCLRRVGSPSWMAGVCPAPCSPAVATLMWALALSHLQSPTSLCPSPVITFTACTRGGPQVNPALGTDLGLRSCLRCALRVFKYYLLTF